MMKELQLSRGSKKNDLI